MDTLRALLTGTIAVLFSACALPRPQGAQNFSKTRAERTARLHGLDGHAIHEHGGPGAKLGSFRFELENLGQVPRRVRVPSVEFLTGHDCARPPTSVRARPPVSAIAVEEGPRQSELEVRALSRVTLVVFLAENVEAYYTHCDRFAFRAKVLVDEEMFEVASEVKVSRESP